MGTSTAPLQGVYLGALWIAAQLKQKFIGEKELERTLGNMAVPKTAHSRARGQPLRKHSSAYKLLCVLTGR